MLLFVEQFKLHISTISSHVFSSIRISPANNVNLIKAFSTRRARRTYMDEFYIRDGTNNNSIKDYKDRLFLAIL